MRRYARKDERLAMSGSVRLVWQDDSGFEKFVRGRCLDVSQSGLRMELPEAIPVRSYVTVKADQVGLAVNAAVRHCAPSRGKYIVGLEFSVPLRMSDPRAAELLKRLLEEAGQEPSGAAK
jgi:hypothetical protein